MQLLEKGLPDFFGPNIPKREKISQMTINYTRRPYIRPNGRDIFQMAIKYNNIFHSKALQKLPKLGFLFENKPSGNPGWKKVINKAAKSLLTGFFSLKDLEENFYSSTCVMEISKQD
jgi:hypothetical protein